MIPTAAVAAAAAAAATTAAAAAGNGGGGNTLRVYRRLLGLARRMQPAERRAEALRQIRAGFRQHAQEGDEERVRALLDKASSTLGYLKMVTPRRGPAAPAEATAGPTEKQGGGEEAGDDGRVRLVYKNGEGLIDGEAEARDRARYSNWHGGNLDPDSVSRHQHQLGRAGFRDNAHAKGFF